MASVAWLVVVFGVSGLLFERSCLIVFAFILPLKSSKLATDKDETPLVVLLVAEEGWCTFG